MNETQLKVIRMWDANVSYGEIAKSLNLKVEEVQEIVGEADAVFDPHLDLPQPKT